jgi:tetratricopeptide (TPR) repeat protein
MVEAAALFHPTPSGATSVRTSRLSALLLSASLLAAPVALAQQPPQPAPTSRDPLANVLGRAIAGKKVEIDALLGKLKAAPSEEAAGALEEQIRQKWIDGGSPAATLLMNKGLRNLHTESGDEALGDFDAALVLEPELHAAYSLRARAKFLTGDYTGALRDIQAALQREPRNFMALQGLSRIAEARGDAKGALLAWQKLLEIDPKTPESDKRLRELNRKVNGEAT